MTREGEMLTVKNFKGESTMQTRKLGNDKLEHISDWAAVFNDGVR